MQDVNAKRVHDLLNALRSFRFAVEALERGYRFDDEMAGEKIKRLKDALLVLETEYPETIKLIEGKVPTAGR